MSNRVCALFLFDGYADWEPALATALLRQYGQFDIVPFSTGGGAVESMGGLQVQPQTAVEAVEPANIDLLLLPGGTAWEQGDMMGLLPLVQRTADAGTTIAAICGATILLGRAGLLDTLPHTSNTAAYLRQHCPEYRGEQFYKQAPCVVADGIITANGAAMIEFAHEICTAVGILDAGTRSKVLDLYKSGGMVNGFVGDGEQ